MCRISIFEKKAKIIIKKNILNNYIKKILEINNEVKRKMFNNLKRKIENKNKRWLKIFSHRNQNAGVREVGGEEVGEGGGGGGGQ